MSAIYVVRHGQDFDNANKILNGRRDEALTPIGREQAKATGVKLQKKEIEFIYTSPALRAQQTAQIIAEIIGVEKIITEADLIESDFGILTGKPLADIPKFSKNIFVGDKINFFLDGEGVEEYDDLLVRANRVLHKIISQHPDNNVLIVTHGGTGKMIETAWHGWTWEYGLTTPYFDNADVLELMK
jgi:probable phosphoglycerate mutase